MKTKSTQTTHAAFTLLAFALLVISCAPRVQAANGPLNGKIVFESERDGNKEIYTMSTNGFGQVNISNNPALDVNPSWSPDGTKIAFNSDRDGNPEIYVMNADGSNVTRLTFLGPTDGSPSWSPDGTKIAFQTNRAGVQNFEIFVMNADGTNQTRLTNSAGNDLHPRWSPDGRQIIFDSLRDGNAEIYVMDSDGTNQTRLTNNTVSDQIPSFSPDGTQILFQRHVNSTTAQILLMNVNGIRPRQLTTTGANFSPAFSPDGTKISFQSSRDGNPEIYTMDADGSNEVRLTNDPEFDGVTTWQPVPKTDTIGVFRPSTGQFFLRNSNTAGTPNITVSFGQSGDQPLAGDWNGDGFDDVGVFRPSTGQFRLRQTAFANGQPTNVSSTLVITFGQAGDLAVVGDWNNDGIDTPGVFRPSTGQFLLTNSPNTNNSSPPANVTVFFGQSGDLPVAGDWNNDGIDSIGVYREAAGCSFFLSDNNSTVNITAANFCGVDPISPIVGDWNGNGVDTIGIHSGALAAFSLSNSNASLTGAAEIQVAFGQAGDLPVSGDWNGGN